MKLAWNHEKDCWYDHDVGREYKYGVLLSDVEFIVEPGSLPGCQDTGLIGFARGNESANTNEVVCSGAVYAIRFTGRRFETLHRGVQRPIERARSVFFGWNRSFVVLLES